MQTEIEDKIGLKIKINKHYGINYQITNIIFFSKSKIYYTLSNEIDLIINHITKIWNYRNLLTFTR